MCLPLVHNTFSHMSGIPKNLENSLEGCPIQLRSFEAGLDNSQGIVTLLAYWGTKSLTLYLRFNY